MTETNETLFRVRYHQEESICEIYARSLAQESIYGFIEVEEIVFNESSGIVVDPAEEKMKKEFEDVICTYIPMHSVIRIDEVKKQGVAKIKDAPAGAKLNISLFPGTTKLNTQKKS